MGFCIILQAILPENDQYDRRREHLQSTAQAG